MERAKPSLIYHLRNVGSVGPVKVRPNRWGVPAAVLLVTAASFIASGEGSFSATGGTIIANHGVDPTFALNFLVVPISGALTAAVAYFSIAPLGRRGPVVGPIVGALVGLGASFAIGYQYQSVDTWWLTSVPTDTNQAAAWISAFVVAWTSVTAVLCLASTRALAGARRPRNRILGLAILAGLLGGVVGMFAGGLAAAVGMAQQNSFLPDVVSAADSGAWIGLLVGTAVGVMVGALTALIAGRVEPPVPESASTSA